MAGHVQIHLPISFQKVPTRFSKRAWQPVQVNDTNDIASGSTAEIMLPYGFTTALQQTEYFSWHGATKKLS
jgi:hypothetical protein